MSDVFLIATVALPHHTRPCQGHGRFYKSYVCNALKSKKFMFDYLARIRQVLTLREVE